MSLYWSAPLLCTCEETVNIFPTGSPWHLEGSALWLTTLQMLWGAAALRECFLKIENLYSRLKGDKKCRSWSRRINIAANSKRFHTYAAVMWITRALKINEVMRAKHKRSYLNCIFLKRERATKTKRACLRATVSTALHMKRPAENKSGDLSGSLDLFFMEMHVDMKPLWQFQLPLI